MNGRRGALVWILAWAALHGRAQAQQNVMLVMDASGSMTARIDGRAKMDIARDAVDELVKDWVPANGLGLVAYGHRSKGDCKDIERLLEPRPNQASAVSAAVHKIRPKGMTPISAAVIEAARALEWSEHKATVILVSDGEETCNQDPCQVAKELEQRGVDFTVHVVGFDVADAKKQAQLRCLAENTGGRFFQASNAPELRDALGVVAASSTASKQLPPAAATLSAPDGVGIGDVFEVHWTGPLDKGDYVALAYPSLKLGRDLDYESLRKPDQVVSLRAPAKAGEYELRYISEQRAQPILARRTLRVGEAEATLDAPEQAVVSSTVAVKATGPVDRRHWIGFAPEGSGKGAYLDYKRPTGPTSEVELRAPSHPGVYELRYVLNESERVLASRRITIINATATVDAPAEVMATMRIHVTATGPVGPQHWIGFAPKGSPAGAYRDYVRPKGTTTDAELEAPVEPGEYEIRYVLDEREAILAARPIRVTPAIASIDSAPDAVKVGETIEVTASGPVAPGHWIGFAPAGSSAGTYRAYARPTGSTSHVELKAPETPGDYELRFVLKEREKVAARKPIKVLPK